MTDRGVIRNREYAQQIRDFRGLRWGNITPTDIDGFVEFNDRLFVFVESKHGGSPLSGGQRLALQRLVDAVHQPPEKISIGLLVSHNTSGDIDFANLPVTQYRYNGKWLKPAEAITLKTAIDKMIRKVKPHLRRVA